MSVASAALVARPLALVRLKAERRAFHQAAVLTAAGFSFQVPRRSPRKKRHKVYAQAKRPREAS